MARPISYLAWFVGALAGVLALIAAVNVGADPARVFGGGVYESKMARDLAAGRAVDDVGNYDERVMQRHYVRALAAPKEVVVLGSSRAMAIGERHFPGQSVFNHSVSGASIEDYLAIAQMYRNRGFIAERVVIGLDPWVLNANNGQFRWSSVKAEFHAAVADLGIALESPRYLRIADSGRWATLISLSYFTASLREIWRGRTSDTTVPDAENRTGRAVKRADGSLALPAGRHGRTPAEVTAHAVAQARGPGVYSLGIFDGIDGTAVALLRGMIDRLHRDGAQVVLALLPYHPQAYDVLIGRDDYRIIAEVEAFVRDLGRQSGATVIGSYDSERVGCVPAEFIDFQHFDDVCTDKVMAPARRP